jgi:hypothetical protein
MTADRGAKRLKAVSDASRPMSTIRSPGFHVDATFRTSSRVAGSCAKAAGSSAEHGSTARASGLASSKPDAEAKRADGGPAGPEL